MTRCDDAPGFPEASLSPGGAVCGPGGGQAHHVQGREEGEKPDQRWGSRHSVPVGRWDKQLSESWMRHSVALGGLCPALAWVNRGHFPVGPGVSCAV